MQSDYCEPKDFGAEVSAFVSGRSFLAQLCGVSIRIGRGMPPNQSELVYRHEYNS